MLRAARWWPPTAAFVFTGLLGLAWLSLWAVVSRDARLRSKAAGRVPDHGAADARLGDRRVLGTLTGPGVATR
jgi:hypothetical protein